MKRRLVSLLLCFALLASILAVPGIVSMADTISWQDGAVGQYAIVTETPDETPLNQGIRPKQGTSSTEFGANPNWGSSGNLANLTDGDLTNKSMIYFSQVGTTQYWENITFDLGAVKQVDRALVGSAESGPRNVYVKFYASTDLATLYDNTNLMAETKDGLSATELTVLLKGEAKAARYVGISTYLFNANLDNGKYPNIAGYSNQMRFSEIAFYEAAEEEPTLTGSYEVVTEAPDETPLNQGIRPKQGTSSTEFGANPNWGSSGNLANLTDGDLTNKSMIYFSQVGTTQYWENITFDLGAVKQVDRALVGSAESGPRNVCVKFYASTDLATLYDASNLMAETKDGLSATELTVLLKGEAKAARYVGISTYLFNANLDSGKYSNIAGYGNQMRFSEIAVYAADMPWTECNITATENTDKIIANKDNILASATCTSANQKALYTDGKIAGVNAGEAYSNIFGGTDGSPTYVGFDLGSRYVIDSLLVGGGGDATWGGIGNGTFGVDIYVSDYSRDQIRSNPALAEPVYTTTDTIAFGRRIELDEAATGQHVVFALYGAPSTSLKTKIWVSELGATGTPVVVPDPGPPADEYGYYAADTGKYKVLDFVPDETPLNAGCKPFMGTSSTNFNAASGGNVSRLTDGSLDEKQSYYQSNTEISGYWEKITFVLENTATVERLFVASEDAGTRHVAVKFYASTELSNLYEDSNLVAAKDGFGVDELSFLLKGTAKQAKYVGVSTYIPDSATDGGKYLGLGARSSQFRFRELAVYGAATGMEKDKDGFYAADAGMYKVTDSVPTDTPVNAGLYPTKGTTGENHGNSTGDKALLTDGKLDAKKMFYQSVDNKTSYWEYYTFTLNGTYAVDRLFIASEAAAWRHVSIKFYASDKLETLYDEANLIAAKDGLTKDQLNVLIKGEVKEANYVGLATYVAHPTNEATKYPDLSGNASQVRFLELAVYGTLIPDPFTTTVITGSNYQTALPTGKNLLKGADVENKPADYLQMLKPTGVAWADVTTGEGVYNQPLLTDGKMNGINIPTTESNVGSLKNFAGTAFVYDLRGTVDISHLLIHAAKEDNSVNYLVTTLDVYVSDDLDTLLTEEKLVESFTFTLAENVKLFTTDTQVGAIKGRYVAFKPNYCQHGMARFGELGVYGTYESGPRDFDRPIFEETVVTSENYQTTLPTEKNLLLGEGINNKPAAYLQMLKPDGAPWGVSENNSNGLTNYANLIDGKLNGINTDESNVGSLKNSNKGAFVYDLRGTVDISKLLIQASKEDNHINYLVTTIEVYVGDSLDTLLSDDSYIQTVSFTMAENVKVFTPKEEIKGRYIAFLPQYCQYSIARFGELGVYGTYEDGPRDFDVQIIQGKQPIDYYYAPMGKPATKLDIIPMADRQEATPVDVETLTNGSWDDRTQFDLRTAIGEAGDGFEYGPGGTLKQGVPWVVLVYYLEGTVDVNTISVAGLTGSTAIAGVDFYVGKLQMELFNSENKVYTTNGEKTYWDAEAEDTYLDPAYDKSQQLHTIDLGNQGGVEGRYVGIVITRPYACDKQGWGFARLSEVEVGGTRIDYDPAFTDDMHIWTDAATGITANLSRLNNDDMAFFQNIGGMTVIKTAIPADLERDIDDHWLTVDGDYAYTIQLKDKSGKIISNEELGNRYWKITFPNESGEFRMMGLLEKDTVTRLRHSYSSADDKHVIVGNDMKLKETMVTGNGLTFVYLRYNTLEHIEKQNGIGDTEFVPYITAGAAGTVPVESTPWWLYGLVALLLAGCVYTVMSTRRVRQ